MKVIIVIVTFNGMKWLKKCMDSCKAYTVVVVDNGSTDDSVNFIKTNYNNVHVIESSENLGFGKANNIGISYALSQNAESVFLLNQDAYLVDDVLDKLCDVQKTHSDYGILSPVHVNGAQDKLDFYFSNYVSNTKNPFFYSDHVLNNQLKEVYVVPFVNAAAWLISKACLEKVGGFDPLFFHYSEDNNYCQRVAYHGFKIGVVPKSYIIHDRKEGKPQKMKPYSPKFYEWKERLYKSNFANVNNDDPQELYKIETKKLQVLLVKAFIKLDFKTYKGLIIQRKKLKALMPGILKSYNTNKIQQSHYL